MYNRYHAEQLVKVNPIYSLSHHSHGLRHRVMKPNDCKQMRWNYLMLNFKNILPLVR